MSIDRSYVRTSSLARKFFEDFPEATELPLLLPDDQQVALEQYVRPLLNLEDTSTAGCCDAVKQLLPFFSAAGGLETYRSARAAADYVQSPLALCILDTAAAFSLLPGAAALAEQEPDAFGELLSEDLRRRLVANKLDKLDASTAAAAGSVGVLLDYHLAVKAATPAAGDPDRLVLPDSAAFRCCRSSSDGDTAPASLSCYLPFKHVTDAVRQHLLVGQQADSGSSSHTILKRAVWRRQLTRECSHYLAPILGKDAAGTVLLVGSSLASIVKGYHGLQDSSGSSSSRRYQISFAGYASSDAAQEALEGCVTEVLTRYFARHPQPVTDAAGAPVYPVSAATPHHLLLLLPEPTETQLPAAVGVPHDALVAAAAAGAWNGPAAAAAAAADPAAAAADPAAVAAAAAATQGAQPPPAAAAAAATALAATGSAGTNLPQIPSSVRQPYRDIELCFDLSLHPSIDAVLLSAPNQLAAFCYDGDSLHTLPSAVRALASGALLLDPSAVARGASWCGDSPPPPPPQQTNEPAAGPAAAAAAAPAAGGGGDGGVVGSQCGATKLLSSAVLSPDRVAAAVRQVAAAAATGWQPVLLLPMLLPASSSSSSVLAADNAWLQQLCTAATASKLPEALGDISSSGSSSRVAPLLPAAGSLWQQLLVADVGSFLTSGVGGSSINTLLESLGCQEGSSSSSTDSNGSNPAAAAVAGERWWQQLSRKFTAQQAHETPQAAASAAAAAGAPSFRQPAAAEVSPAALMQQPQLLRRALLTPAAAPSPGQAAAPEAAAATAAAQQAQRQLQQLSRVHGWVWSSVDPQQQQQQQQQEGCKTLPAVVRDAVRSRWWAGPVMRGSLLEGEVIQQ